MQSSMKTSSQTQQILKLLKSPWWTELSKHIVYLITCITHWFLYVTLHCVLYDQFSGYRNTLFCLCNLKHPFYTGKAQNISCITWWSAKNWLVETGSNCWKHSTISKLAWASTSVMLWWNAIPIHCSKASLDWERYFWANLCSF